MASPLNSRATRTPVKNTTLPKDAIVRFKEDGAWHYYRITDANTSWHTGVCMDCVALGTPIYSCVWKDRGTRLEVRSVTHKKTPATKTEAQWIAEGKARYDEHIKRQMEYRANFDALIAGLKDENDPIELTKALFNAALKGTL